MSYVLTLYFNKSIILIIIIFWQSNNIIMLEADMWSLPRDEHPARVQDPIRICPSLLGEADSLSAAAVAWRISNSSCAARRVSSSTRSTRRSRDASSLKLLAAVRAARSTRARKRQALEIMNHACRERRHLCYFVCFVRDRSSGGAQNRNE